jgi:hypothetical protein
MPWIVVDYKRDKSIAEIPYAHFIDIGYIPTQPGVYIVQPLPNQEEAMTDYLMQIWDTEGIGLYIDEGVMLARNDALDNILIQGRSKQIPVIVLTQRPVGISRYAFTEAQYIFIFPNQDKRERKIISEFTPLVDKQELDDYLLPRFHFYYYDVIANKVVASKPVPNLPVILATFAKKLQQDDEMNEPEPEKVAEGIKFIEL